METFLVPLLNIPQDFTISLAGKDYRIVSKFNDAADGGWVLDFYDEESGEPLVMNIPMVTGCDLLEQYEYLEFNGKLIVSSDGDESTTPTLESLGVESNLYFKTEVA